MTESSAGPSGNAFEPNKPGTPARSLSEARIEGLRERGGIFAEAVRATRMPMAVTDPSLPGNPIVFVNEAFLALSGYEMAEVLGQGPYFMNGPGTDPTDAVRFREALEQDRDEVVETVQYRKDGSRFVASLFISAFKDERGRTTHQFLSYLDVTRRVAAEERLRSRERMEAGLRESEARHRLLIESWAQAVWEADADGVVVADSSSWRAYTGQALEAWLGNGWLDAIHPDDHTYAGQQWQEAVAARGLVNAEFRLRAPDGGWRWTNVRAAPVLDAEGRVERWVGMNIDIDARRHAEAALRGSEARYRTLFEAMDEAYAVVEVLRDEGGLWHDLRFLEVNRAFMVHTSMPYPVGRTATELLGSPSPRWTQMYGQVLDTGLPMRVQQGEPMLGRTFDLNIFALDRDRNRVAVLFTDVTARLRVEEALRESEERQAFLLKLSDVLRSVGNSLEIQRTATRLLGEQLKASRVFYVLVEEDGDTATILANYADGVPDRLGHYSLSAFSSYAAGEWRAGRTASTDDVNADPRWGEAERAAYASVSTRAGFGIPLIKEGRLVALLGVNQSVPRRWTDAERELAREVAERTWDAVERARAEAELRASEARFRDFAENSTDVLWIADAARRRIEYLSPAFERIFGAPRAPILDGGRMIRDLVDPDDRTLFESAWPRAIAGGASIVHYRIAHPGRGTVHLRDTLFPIRDEAGVIRQVAGIVQDVSDIEAARAALNAEKERFRTLAEGIPPLVWRSCDEGRWTWASPQWRDYTGQSQAESRDLGWLDVVHPDDRARTMAAWRAARPHGRLDVEYRVRHASDGTWRWHQTRSVPVRGGPTSEQPEGRIVEWLGTTTDVEDLKRLGAEQAVLVAELQHRTRNLLAVVRNVARRSIPPQSGRDEYDARLAALGRVQGFLSRTASYAVPLRDLLKAELHAAGDGVSDRVTIGGPPVDLSGEGAQPVALALHELATNAVKYGAIAQPAGRLSATWQVEEEEGGPRLHITWQESGVSMPDGPPARRGYGSELITRALPYQMGAETALEFTPDGVRCRITLPAGAFRRLEVGK